MSFLSDLFEGNFSNLGTDITHAPESAVTDYRSEWVPALAAAGTLATAGILGPELLGGAAVADAAGLGAAEGAAGGTLAAEAGAPLAFGSAADIGASTLPADLTTTFGEFSPELFAANTADVAAGGLGTDLTAADLAGAGLTATPLDSSLSGTVIDSATGGPVATGWGDYPLPADYTGPVDYGSSYGADLAQLSGPYTDTGFVDPNQVPLPQPRPDIAVDAATYAAPSGGLSGTDLAEAQMSGLAPGGGAGTPGGATTAGVTPTATQPGFLQQAGDFFTGPQAFQHDLMLGLGAAPLALALLRGEPSIPPQAQQAQANANTLSAFGQQQLAAGMSGQLNTGQLAMVQQLGQNQLNAYRQTLYNMGVKDPTRDTRYAQMEAQVAQDQAKLTYQLLQIDIQNGLTALKDASGTLTTVAQMQMTADQNFTNTLVNATQSLGRNLALSNFAGGRTTTTTTVQQAA